MQRKTIGRSRKAAFFFGRPGLFVKFNKRDKIVSNKLEASLACRRDYSAVKHS
jgi:hypothetical protein